MEYVLIWLVVAALSAYFARVKGRNPALWFVIGFIFSFLALAFLWFMPEPESGGGKIQAGTKSLELSDKHRKCPFCAETVLNEAIKCKHCGSELEPVSSHAAEKSEYPAEDDNPMDGAFGEHLPIVLAAALAIGVIIFISTR
ncbi:conserved membrane protein of unknown function [Pseudomonas marincola]|uniref:Zinc ribbon domain-containing protein n=1 Tax=Pseudomonas marincola TaxID=437900 RepID=A0A653E892_9PSED|nr:hypothetical protein [Pseudomonas marincola]CAE6906885.1 conserved membrane protein of unknown function [Pseudomonas marincola]